MAATGFGARAELRVAASTTFVGDVVRAIGGDAVRVDVVYPRNADPHAYEPTPRDLAARAGEKILFVNGVGLDETLRRPLDNLKQEAPEIINVSRGIVARRTGDEFDPHVWADPVCVATWTTNIEAALTKLDPNHAGDFRRRAESYRAELAALDADIRRQIEKVPEDRRLIVTDHDELHYFAERYGLKIVGVVLPSFSTLSEPSPRDLAALEKSIRELKAPAVFAAGDVPAQLVKRVAADTGARLVQLPGCSLGEANCETGTLTGWLKTTAERIVGGLARP